MIPLGLWDYPEISGQELSNPLQSSINAYTLASVSSDNVVLPVINPVEDTNTFGLPESLTSGQRNIVKSTWIKVYIKPF